MILRVVILNLPSLVSPRVFLFKLSPARNVLLFRLLIHDRGTDPQTFWKMMFHLHVDEATFNDIKFYSHEQYNLAESLEYWKCGRYSDVIRFYNSESLEAVREIWRRYSSPDTLDPSFIKNYNNAIKKVYKTYHEASKPLAADTLAASTKQFWKSGASPSSSLLPNPLFAYSESSSRFALHPDSNPLAGFPLNPSIAKLAPESPFFLGQHPGNTPLETATTSAKFQFQAWCNSFRQYRSKGQSTSFGHLIFCG
jgi:hypothetical protein